MPRPEVPRLLFLIGFLLFPVFVSATPGVAGTEAVAAFDKGMAAFRTGEYARAREWFRRASGAGLDTPQLTYNLGVTAFRLERYEEAEAAFSQLTGRSDWAAVALYNLGLVAERRQRFERAAEFFRRVAGEESTEELHHLAMLGLERIDAIEGAGSMEHREAGFLSLAAGYDSNPGLISGEETVEGNDGDRFVHLFATGRLALGEHGYLDAGGYDRRHADGSEFDLQGLYVAPGISWREGRREEIYTLSLGHDRFGGEAYRETLTMRGEGRCEQGAGELRLAARLRRIEAVPEYDHLDGWQLRLEGRMEYPLAGGRALLGYRLEENRRRDWTDGTDSADYSPRRHSLIVGGDWSLSAAWWLRAELEYRHSRHPSVEVAQGETLARRVDELLEGLLRVGTSLSGEAPDLFAELTLSEQRSNLPGYAYKRAGFMAGLEWGW